MTAFGSPSTVGRPALVRGGRFSLFSAASSGSMPVLVGEALQGGVVGVPYAETVSAQGGTSPYIFAVTFGALPAGLTLAGSTGIISGIPSADGTLNFTVSVTDVNGATGSQAFTITVAAPTASSSAGNYGWIQ